MAKAKNNSPGFLEDTASKIIVGVAVTVISSILIYKYQQQYTSSGPTRSIPDRQINQVNREPVRHR